MRQAASSLADRKELQGTAQKERIFWAEGSGNQEVILDKRADWLLQGYFPEGNGSGPSGS